MVIETIAKVALAAAEKVVEKGVEKLAEKAFELPKWFNSGKSQLFDSIMEFADRPIKDIVNEREWKKELGLKTGWSKDIIDLISSPEEAEVYDKAGLKPETVNGRQCLIRSDIDWLQADEHGLTNDDRAERGLSPLDRNSNAIELHHNCQKADGPFAELSQAEHRNNYSKLHDPSKHSEIDRVTFNKERSQHWQERSEKEREVRS